MHSVQFTVLHEHTVDIFFQRIPYLDSKADMVRIYTSLYHLKGINIFLFFDFNMFCDKKLNQSFKPKNSVM